MFEESDNSKWYYKIVYFFIANQVLLKRLLVVLLLFLNIVVWLYVGIKFVNYSVDTKNYNNVISSILKENIDWKNIREKNKAQELQIIKINKIRVKEDKYDFVAQVSNSNSNWIIKNFDYAFLIDGNLTDWKTSFVLPNENKFLFNFGYLSKNIPEKIALKTKNISWMNIKNDDKNYILENISVSDKKITKTTGITSLNFKTENNSPFSFWQIGWQIILLKNDRPIAIHYLTKNNFLSGEHKNCSVNWLEKIGSYDEIKIIPEVNLYDKNIFMTDLDINSVNLIRGAKTER